jgi:mono/diheme cytochrome c family protein
MLNRLVFIVGGTAAIVAGALAQQSTVTVPVSKTPPNNGKQMFMSYCAPCHGANGKGNGPVASSLVQKPVDLTVLAKNNGGKFPEAHFIAILNFGSNGPAAHGAKDMPVWGPILGSMEHQTSSPDAQPLREKNLESYVESLQVK